MAILSQLKPPEGARRPRTRFGRGPGSGLGKTAGRGQKGQKARVGHGKRAFEGGQMPLQRRMPKVGFKNPFALDVAHVNVGDLDGFEVGAIVTVESLQQRRLVRARCDVLKVLGDGALTKKLTVRAHAFSASARAKIEAAGGTAEVLATEKASAS